MYEAPTDSARVNTPKEKNSFDRVFINFDQSQETRDKRRTARYLDRDFPTERTPSKPESLFPPVNLDVAK